MIRPAGMRSTGEILRRAGAGLGCAFFAGAAALYALTTLCAIVNFGFRQPMFDQWREYETLLGLPFPQNVIQLANGHRPIVANLIRVAEAHWFGADQILQLTVGTLCAYLTAMVLAVAAWQERDRTLLVRCVAVMLAVLSVLWMGNARRLLHGSESLHGHLPTLATMLGCLCVFRAHVRGSAGWIWAASACCTIATFSFGVGLASFPAVILLMLLLRAPLRQLWVPAATMLSCVVLYVFVLPGSQGVRSQIDWNPVDAARLIGQWISSPWVTGLLDLADHPERLPAPALRPWYMSVALLLAQTLSDGTGASTETLSALIGFAAILGFVTCVALAFRSPHPPGRLESLAIGGGTYALASAALTTLARVPALLAMPGQIFAPRYITWPCLFWSCLALLGLWRFARNPLTRLIGLPFLAMMPLVLFATQDTQTVWGALVYRRAQQTSAALRSGVYDTANFPGESLGAEVEQREIELLRRDRLAMFRDGAWKQVGKRWTGMLQSAGGIAADVHWLEGVRDGSGEQAGHFEGWITEGIRSAQRGGQLVLLDADDTIVGLAEYSFISPVSSSLMLRLPRKRGFDGYVQSGSHAGPYRLAVADFANGKALLVGTLPMTSEVSGELQTTGIRYEPDAESRPSD